MNWFIAEKQTSNSIEYFNSIDQQQTLMVHVCKYPYNRDLVGACKVKHEV
jgi:hypothetical protein